MQNIEKITPNDSQWPTQLAVMGDKMPEQLYLLGNAELLTTTQLAVVGARASTGYGHHLAGELAAGLATESLTVLSGGAYGVDGTAHRAALAVSGSTIAVMAGGLNRLYPAGHRELLERIGIEGLLVSELEPDVPPTQARFLRRNHVMAALSAEVVVVEAARRSGSLETAAAALEFARPVAAFPGPVTSPSSAGGHALIKQGRAQLVESVDDVIDLLKLSQHHTTI